MFSRPVKQVVQEVATPTPTDTANQQQTERKRRLETGGRNATFLSQTATAAAADRSPATLTGLSGLGSRAGGV